MTSIYDTILWLQSESTGKLFPTVELSADTDMVTLGWVSLTSIERPEVVVTQATPEEYRFHNIQGDLQIERRINAALGRTDLRSPWLIEVEEHCPGAPGISFKEYMKVYRPPTLIFRDIFDEGSTARVVSEITQAEFENDGGRLFVL